MSKKRAKLRVEYVKSTIGYSQRQKSTIRALGFKRLGDIIEVEDNDAMRGMLSKVSHLVQVQQVK
jgi:large subunit ribosomal protein L30